MTILPGISAFVGADIVAGIYALEMDRKKNALLLDIGTNGEMAAGGADGFLVTSAAAGPVFEGGNISCGVAGVPGAVTSLVLERDPAAIGGIRTVELSTIAGETPIGLCGTGIIDAVGEAVRLGLIDENGTFEEPWFTDGMPVAEGRFRFRQEDVRQVQMGKAAIRAGIETLLAEYGGGDPEEILIAGGFGCRMDEEQTIRIGLFPEQFRDISPDWQQCACGSTAVSARRQDGGKTEACVYHRARTGTFACHAPEIQRIIFGRDVF